MMRIGVLSDTHSHPLPAILVKELKNFDFIIHAGDFCDTGDFEAVSKLNDLKAVHGNMDSEALRKKLPRSQIIPCGKWKIGLFHGEGPPQTLLDKVRAEFKGQKLDAIVFGHSHQPMNEKMGDVLFFNPGSPNDAVFAPYFSYGILEVGEKGVTGKIVRIDHAHG